MKNDETKPPEAASVADIPEVEPPKQRTPQERAALRAKLRAMLDERMAKAKIKGNCRDYVLLKDQETLITEHAVYKLGARFPTPLVGAYVWIFSRDSVLIPVRVKEDNGQKLLVTNDIAEAALDRDECYPTPIPRDATIVHRRDLGRFIGTEPAQAFWDAKRSRPREP